MICTTWNDLYYVERFVQRWKICTTLNYSECNGWFADFQNVESFGLRYISEYRFFNPKMAGGCQFEPPLVFRKNVSSKDRVKPWFFVTFNVIISHIFPENVIGMSQVVQKILRNSLSILAIFINFHRFFFYFFNISLLQRH